MSADYRKLALIARHDKERADMASKHDAEWAAMRLRHQADAAAYLDKANHSIEWLDDENVEKLLNKVL